MAERKVCLILAAVWATLGLGIFSHGGEPRGPAPILEDVEIAAALDQVKADNLKALVQMQVDCGTRHTLSFDPKGKEPRGLHCAIEGMAEYFRGLEEAAGGRLTTHVQHYQLPKTKRTPKGGTAANVYAVLQAEPPTPRTLVVSGHIDSRVSDVMNAEADAPGANDDASGVAAVAELARVFAPLQFKVNLVFLAVSGEEQGLLGSEAFLQEAKSRGWSIEAFITNDIIGGAAGGNGEKNRGLLRVFSQGIDPNMDEAMIRRIWSLGGEDDGPARQLARAFEEAAETYVPEVDVQLVKRLDRYGRGGDHIPPSRAGIPAVRVSERWEDYAHEHQDLRIQGGLEYGDLMKFMDFDHLAEATRCNGALLATLARAPAVPAWVNVDAVMRHEGVLTWATVPGAIGYEILWRQTDQNHWSGRVGVPAREGEHQTFTAPVDGDHFHFAVRSLSPQGHPGLPATAYWHPKPR